MGSFSDASAVWGLILLNFEPLQDFMDVLITCKNKENQSKKKELEWS